MYTLVFWIVLADPTVISPLSLVPGPDQYVASLAASDTLLRRATAIERALSRIHNRWADTLVFVKKPICPGDEIGSLPARSEILLRAHRNASQSAEKAVQRLLRVARAPTLEGIIDQEMRERVAQRVSQSRDQRRRHLELSAWHNRFLRGKCPRTLSSPISGIASRIPGSTKDSAAPIAVIVVGSGTICPQGLVATDGVVVVNGDACFGDTGCSCAPGPVLPGAVFAQESAVVAP